MKVPLSVLSPVSWFSCHPWSFLLQQQLHTADFRWPPGLGIIFKRLASTLERKKPFCYCTKWRRRVYCTQTIMYFFSCTAFFRQKHNHCLKLEFQIFHTITKVLVFTTLWRHKLRHCHTCNNFKIVSKKWAFSWCIECKIKFSLTYQLAKLSERPSSHNCWEWL